jgi:ubiquinone/menaquinone biosynthesis C-methylase UbiE
MRKRGAMPSKVDSFSSIAPYYDALMATVPYARWADYVSQLAALSGRLIRPGSRLLDLATGTGSVALEFAERSCTVVGIDLSEPMLMEARRKAAERGLQVEFICSDLARFEVSEVFDHAVCLYDSFNYLTDPDDLKRAFANISSALAPDGLLIFDVNTVHALEAELFTQTSFDDAPVKYRWVSKYDPKTRTSQITMHFEIPAAKEQFSIVHEQRAYTESELRAFLHHAGFADIKTYSAYRVVPPTPLSDRAFYVARAAGRSG